MKKKMITFGGVIAAVLFALLAVHHFYTREVDTSKEPDTSKKEPAEYLHITATAYNNRQNDDDGISLVLYLYSIRDQTMSEIARFPIDPDYPVAFADLHNNKVYFSDSNPGEDFDNLFEYDLKTKERKQLTYGKFLFNDLFIAENKMIANVAPQYATVTQPGMFDRTTNTFTYLNPNDDDTWCFSLSYNYTTKKLLSLTTSDTEMRTPKVREVTFIRPKTLYLMDLDFGNYQPIYHTDQFEIRLTRQLDANRILMTWDPFMGASKPRTLRMLYLDTQKVEDFDVPGIKEVKSFYPRDNAEGIFILGRDLNNTYGLFYYDLVTKQVSNLFEKYPLPKNHRSLVDFVYSMNLNPRHASGGGFCEGGVLQLKRKLFFPIGLIVMALIVAGIFYFFIEKNKRYSFSEIVSIHEGDIAAVLVDSDSTTEFIRDQREIKKFMASFSKVEVSKFDEDLPFDKSCKISLINDTTVLYLIFLYDNGTIEIYDRAKRKLNQYKIRNNDFNYEEMVKRKTACGATCKQQLLAAAELS